MSSHDGILRGYRRRGACAWASGEPALHVLLIGAQRLRDRPRVLAGASYVLGWMIAGLRRDPRAEREVRDAVRRDTLGRIRTRARRESAAPGASGRVRRGRGSGFGRARDEGREVAGAHVLVALEPLPHPFDVRVRAIVESLVGAGCDVSVVCPTGHGHERRSERIGPVRVERFQAPPGGEGVLGYLREYVVSLWRLTRIARRIDRERPVDLVLVCNPPDLLAGLKYALRHRPRLLRLPGTVRTL